MACISLSAFLPSFLARPICSESLFRFARNSLDFEIWDLYDSSNDTILSIEDVSPFRESCFLTFSTLFLICSIDIIKILFYLYNW